MAFFLALVFLFLKDFFVKLAITFFIEFDCMLGKRSEPYRSSDFRIRNLTFQSSICDRFEVFQL